MFPSLRQVFNSEKSRIPRRELAIVVTVAVFGGGLLYLKTEPVRENNRRMTCAGHLRQIGLALEQYAYEHDDTLPRAWFGKDAGPSDAKTNYKWIDAISPYIKDGQLFVCPEDRVNKPYRFRSGTNYGSYVMNNAYFAAGDKFTPPSGIKLSQVEAPFSTLLVVDGESDFQFSWPNSGSAPGIMQSQPRRLSTIVERHGTAQNILVPLYLDGHVLPRTFEGVCNTKAINGQQIFTGLTIEED